ncbi:MAG: sigma-54-dependent transcriptional regulator [Myxococcota bacterium]
MGKETSILVVDDSEGIRNYLKNLLSIKGYQVRCASDGEQALGLLSSGYRPSIIVLDVMMPGLDGLDTLRRIKSVDEEVPVIMLSVVGKARTIVEAMNLGASDYLNKPFEEEELDISIKKVLESSKLRGERDYLRSQLSERGAWGDGIVWISPKMTKIKDLIEQIAETDVTVLIQGESGVGKEVISRAIHARSLRTSKPFVKVNCAALPEQLLESELFGYEKGAFTGASSRKPGKFEFANHGTIFLDEIGEMSPLLQAKLLQVLQDGEFSRLGGQRDIKVDVRVLVATNRNLEKEVEENRFREDLYYRLNVVNIRVPPMRERREEIPILAEQFLERYNRKYNKHVKGVSPGLMKAFLGYEWSGNVRELENMIKRIVVLENEASIMEELKEQRPSAARPAVIQNIVEMETGTISPLKEVGRRAAMEAERETIARVLHQTNWNRKKAAKILNISYKTLLQKIKESGLAEDH